MGDAQKRTALCRIEMLGRFRVTIGGRPAITRFRTQKVADLFAFLALGKDRLHSREMLVEMFWPEAPIEKARNSLSVSLSSLRGQLEPPGTPAGALLIRNHMHLGLNADQVVLDVEEMEAALDRAEALLRQEGPASAYPHLEAALRLRQGPLLPASYEPWVLAHENRLSDHLTKTIALFLKSDDPAIDRLPLVRAALSIDALQDHLVIELLERLAQSGRHEDVRRTYQQLERARAELGESMPDAVRPLVSEAQSALPRRHARSRRPRATASPEEPPSQRAPHRGGVPIPIAPLFGRVEEKAHLRSLVTQGKRLICLTGMGGVGKTRLGLACAQELAQLVPECEAVYVPLTTERGIGALERAVRMALGPECVPPTQPEGVLMHLEQAPTLLLLDGFEHLLETDAPAQLQGWLERAPSLHCLVTSRFRLGVPGEQELPLTPLPTPPPEAIEEAIPALLAHWPSVALFVDRAQRAMPHFQITRQVAPAIIDLVRYLEGIPLALELAAARTRSIPPARMRQQLARRLDLSAPARTLLPERHRSLRAAQVWSYQLLPPPVQEFFAQLSLLEGEFTESDAKAVTQCSVTLDYLAELRDDSMIQGIDTDEQVLFRLPEIMREFARECLSESALPALAQRHAEHFTQVAQGAWREVQDGEAEAGLAMLERCLPNGQSALDRCLAQRIPEASSLAYRLAIAFSLYWRTRGAFAEGVRRLSEVADLPVDDALLRLRLLNALGTLHMMAGEPHLARARFLACREICQTIDHHLGLAVTAGNLGILADQDGELECARQYHEANLAGARAQNSERNIGIALANLGVNAIYRNDLPEGRRLLEESLEIARRMGDILSESLRLHNLGELALLTGDKTLAEILLRESLLLGLRLGDIPTAGRSLLLLGILYCHTPQGEAWILVARDFLRVQGLPLPPPTQVVLQRYGIFWETPLVRADRARQDLVAALNSPPLFLETPRIPVG